MGKLLTGQSQNWGPSLWDPRAYPSNHEARGLQKLSNIRGHRSVLFIHQELRTLRKGPVPKEEVVWEMGRGKVVVMGCLCHCHSQWLELSQDTECWGSPTSAHGSCFLAEVGVGHQ